MSAQTRDSWKKALLTTVFIVMATAVVVMVAAAPLSFINWTLESNIESLTDELRTCQSPARKVWIIQTLGAINASCATGLLRECLDDQDPAVRAAAVNTLAKMRGLQGLEALAMAAQHPDPHVRKLAKWARSRRAVELSSEEILEGVQGL